MVTNEELLAENRWLREQKRLVQVEMDKARAKVARVEKFHESLAILGNLPIEQRPDGLTASVEACRALAGDLRDALDGTP